MPQPTPKPDADKVFLPVIGKGDPSTPEPTPSPPPGTPTPTTTPTTPTPTPTATSTPGPSQRIAIDPITRIEGHLRLEVQIENGQVMDAWSAGMMFRGIELIMPGRDPRDAWVFTQRICGV